jgi:hypothetical protein
MVAVGIKLADESVVLQSTNSVALSTGGFLLLPTHQSQRLVTEGEEWQPVMGLAILGRTEEASLLAYKNADEKADVATLFRVLNMVDRSDELIAYLEERWTSLDALREDFPPYSGFGDDLMIDVALAYSRTGNQERFDEALDHVRRVHDDLKSQGVENLFFFMSEASYQALAGNFPESLDYLDRAISGGHVLSSPIAFAWPYFAPLEGDPRFEQIQLRMIEHLNSEREKLGLEPVST